MSDELKAKAKALFCAEEDREGKKKPLPRRFEEFFKAKFAGPDYIDVKTGDLELSGKVRQLLHLTDWYSRFDDPLMIAQKGMPKNHVSRFSSVGSRMKR